MRKIYLISTLVLAFMLRVIDANAQDFSNKGKDFWVAYGYHAVTATNQMVLYFAAEQTTNVTVTIPGIAYTANYVVPANTTIASTPIPNSVQLLTESAAPENKGIHITSDYPIVAYAHVYNGSVSGATILFPKSTLGKEYYSVNFTNISNVVNSNCWVYVVAADTGTTTVEITPSANTLTHAAGTPFTVNLTQGQVYNLMGQFSNSSTPPSGVDLSGTKIKSIASGSGGCKKIAVFSGSGRISITCNNSSSSSDNYMVQAFPQTAWGKKYLTVPSVGYNVVAGNTTSASTPNIYRVNVSDPTTVVSINGVVTALPLQNNFYYEIPATTVPLLIEADKPVVVSQYFPSRASGACGLPTTPNNGDGDPEVIYLSSVEQNINKVLWNASAQAAINPSKHYINAIVPNTGTAISSFRLDGLTVPASSFVVHPQDPGFSYVRLNVTSTNGGVGLPHILESDSGFNAIAYGYGSAESYGYNAGTNIKDIFQYISVQNEHATVNFPATCRNTPFYFSMTFPYQPTQIQWIFGPLLNAMGFTDVTLNSPVPTSVIVVAGKTLYVYQLPTNYSIPVTGTYPIKVIANNPTPDGCSGIQEIDFDVQVFDPPVADFNFLTNGCINSPVQFTDNSNTGGRAVISRYWNFADPASGPANTSNLANPTHTFASAGAYPVKYSLITDVGCLADTVIHTVNINELPVANFTASSPYCVDKNVTFDDFSTASGGATLNKWTWNFGDGSPLVVATTGASQVHSFAAAGTYNVTLVVETTSGCESLVFTLPVTVYDNPVADFSLPNVCLPVGAAQFTDLSSYPPGSITAWNWDFGDGNTSTVQNPLHNYTGTGPFTVTLIATSNQGCTDTKVQSLTTVYAEPQAAFTAPAAVCLGGSVSFTDNSTAAGSSVTGWAWNFGDGNTSTLQNPSHTYAAIGNYTVTLNVTSAAGCQTVNNFATRNVEVRPLPTANISGNITVCLNATSPLITFTGANATAPYTFTYNINGGINQTVTTVSGNSVTVAAPTTTAGTFIYTLVSVQDGTSTTCNQLQSGSVTVVVSPLPTASIAGTIAVCQNAPSPNITFTGAVGTAPYTFTYNINGGINQTVTTVSGNSVTVAVPTGTAGTFTYNLISVQEGSANLCSQLQSGSVTVTVNPLPTASVSGTTEVCLNAPSPNITFTGAIGSAPYTFTYNINGGTNQTITTVSGNSITIPVPTGVAGTFVYNLVSVQDGSGTACSQAQPGSATVIVNPLPTRNFSTNTPTCETREIQFTDMSTPNAGSINNWQWNFGDPASGTANTSTLQNPTHIFATTGTYNVSLIVTTDKGCVSIGPAIPVTIDARPLAGFMIPEVCLSDTYAQFTDTSKVALPDNIQAWQWNFGDPPSGPANTSTLQNPQHSYTAVGSYNVELIAISNKGCRDTLVQQLFINGSFPVADFNVLSPSTLCANDSVSISEASTVFPGSITKVEIYWDNVGQPGTFDTDNFPVTGKVYKHKYPTIPVTTTYTIRYRAYSGGVCVNDKLTNITVNAAPIVQFNNMPPACFDAAPFQITQASEIGGVPGTGTFTGPGVSPSGIFSPAVAGIGTFIIKYTFTATAGGCVDSMSKSITVLDTASAQFTYSATACERTAVNFNSTNSTIPAGAGTITGWNWNFGDPASGAANTSTLQNPSHVFSGWGNYNVTLSVTTSNGCRSTNRVTPIFVNPIPQPDFSFPASSCLPSATIAFNSAASSIADGTEGSFSYLWDFGDPASGTMNSSAGANPSHIYNSVGPFTVTLQITSGAGCVNTKQIIVNSIHPQPTGNFNVNRDDICVGETFSFTDNSNPADGTTTQWNWSLGDGNTRTVPAFTYTYGTSGVYDVNLYITNSHGCRSTTFAKQVTVNAYPIVNAGPDLFILQGGSDTIDAVVTATNPTFLWTPNTYFLSSNTIQRPIVKGVEDITYTLTVTGRGNCISTDRVFIKVLKGPEIPNIFSPNGDGVHDKWVIKYLDTYPEGTVEIFNRYGQLIYRSVGYSVPWDGTINGKPVPIGTYYYIVNPKNGRSTMSGYVDVIR